jgi:hypothetical protein
MKYLLEPCDDGVLRADSGVGDLDLDLGLDFSTTRSLGSSLSDFTTLLSSSSDFEFTSESDSVLELSSSVSLFDWSPKI